MALIMAMCLSVLPLIPVFAPFYLIYEAGEYVVTNFSDGLGMFFDSIGQIF